MSSTTPRTPGQPALAEQSRRIAPDVRFRPVFDEGIVIRQRAAEVMVLNEVGLRILDLVSQEQSLAQVVEVLASEFEAAADVLRADVTQFLDELEAAGVVERSDSDPSDRGPAE